MEKLVLDAYPLVVYLKRQPGWEQVRDILKDAARGAEVLSLSLINWGEVIYSAIQDNGRDAGIIVEQVVERLPISIISPDQEMTRTAAEFKAIGGISYADCFAAALAVHENATLVTGDQEFKRLKKKDSSRFFGYNMIFLLRLNFHSSPVRFKVSTTTRLIRGVSNEFSVNAWQSHKATARRTT